MKNKKISWVAVSGGFDPIHVGHLRMLKKARALGSFLNGNPSWKEIAMTSRV